MKQIFFVGILFVFLGTAWVLFLDSGNKRFIENLPGKPHKVVSHQKMPPVLENPQGDKGSSASSKAIDPVETASVDDIKISKSRESESIKPFNEIDPEESIDTGDLNEFFQNSPSTESEVPQKPEGVSLAEWMQGLSQADKEAVYTERPWLKPYTQMTPEELDAEVKCQKQHLIDRYGNTPEVAIINKYTTVASLLGEPIEHTGDEGVEYLRAMSVLWPTEANIQMYQKLVLRQRYIDS